MKKIVFLTIVVLLSLGILTGCQPSTPSGGDESNLSPTPGAEGNAHEVVLYFSDNEAMNIYRVKAEVAAEKESDIPKAALEAWIKGPEHEGLAGFIPSNVIVEYVEDIDGVAHISFSKEIQDRGMGSAGEIMVVEQLAMIMEQFGFDRTQILVEGAMGESLFGHLYTADPIIANDPETYQWIEERDAEDVVLQNVAFRIFEPAPNSEVENTVVVRGLARVFEATVQYEFDDGHEILDKGFTTASEGAPGWGEFEIVIDLENAANGAGTVILYEESAKDGSRLHELQIPVTIVKE